MYNHRSQGDAFQWNEGIHDQSYRFYPDGKQGHETMPFMTGRIVDVKGALGTAALSRLTVRSPSIQKTPWRIGTAGPLP
jgi:hypothetical protein